jgi:aromatic-amino-acid transaminase
MFDASEILPVDALAEIGQLLRADRRPDLIDLGVGLYRDDAGRTPVPSYVKEAEQMLVETQTTKAYVAPDGDPEFARLVASVVLGAPLHKQLHDRLACAQAPGGTGAVRLTMDLIAHARPQATVWLGTPSWPNHAPLIAAAGLMMRTYRHYDPATATFDFAGMAATLDRANAGDIVLLHGCCHNPSGADPDAGQWDELARIITARGLIPLIDMAYQGLGDGLDADAAGIRRLCQLVPEALIAVSCSKSFSLYRERTGLLVALTTRAAAAAKVRSNLQSLARLSYSNPPDHGAAIVRTILDDDILSADWRAGIEAMRRRVVGVRAAFVQATAAQFDLDYVGRQKGLFALLPLAPAAVETLRRDHGIYMARTGRINLAGLNDRSMARFVDALAGILEPVC